MADRWAALLANSATEEGQIVSPAFPDGPGQLSSLDASVLHAVFAKATSASGEHLNDAEFETGEIASVVGLNATDIEFSIEYLLRVRLLAPGEVPISGLPGPGVVAATRERVTLTGFGYHFVLACQPPAEPAA